MNKIRTCFSTKIIKIRINSEQLLILLNLIILNLDFNLNLDFYFKELNLKRIDQLIIQYFRLKDLIIIFSFLKTISIITNSIIFISINWLLWDLKSLLNQK